MSRKLWETGTRSLGNDEKLSSRTVYRSCCYSDATQPPLADFSDGRLMDQLALANNGYFGYLCMSVLFNFDTLKARLHMNMKGNSILFDALNISIRIVTN